MQASAYLLYSTDFFLAVFAADRVSAMQVLVHCDLEYVNQKCETENCCG